MPITFPQSVPLEQLRKRGEATLLESPGGKRIGWLYSQVRTALPLVDHSKPHPEAVDVKVVVA